MKLVINGEERSFSASMTVEALLGELGVDSRKVAVELISLRPQLPSPPSAAAASQPR